MNTSRLPLAGSLLGFLFMLSSCVSTRKSVYFADQNDEVLLSTISIPEPVIQNNDLLSISVSSLNPQASSVFNMPNLSYANTTTAQGTPVQAGGYLVNPEGYIQFPILGAIKAAGLTENQLRTQIVKSLVDKKLLLDPIVTVRHLNFKVTVLGEVAHPTVINVPNEKITMLEALGLAGDITIYGKRDNVMLIREEAGKKTIKRLNLNSTELLSSPYYYLRSNDIVYVEPNKAKVAGSSRATQLLPIVLSGLSFAAIVVDRLTR
ncbi:MAG TPA: polysaccharide biosynthesis/export family protein [Flavisolibacter sp.]|nr:polysaccharide biosynthesis/export family protein [Flavisolibacter sp.]